jgi:hypothetical protein
MRSQKRVSPSRAFRSLLVAVAGALLLTGAFAPRANAEVIVYFNFEDGALPAHPGLPGNVDTAADVTGPPDNNPGGGIQMSTLTDSVGIGVDAATTTGTTTNRTAGDIDSVGSPGLAYSLNRTQAHQGRELCFTANTNLLVDMSLTFAINNSGNGYTSVQLVYTTNFGTPQATMHDGGTQTILNTSDQLFTFNIDPSDTIFKGDSTTGTTQFCLVFTGGQSNGANGETIIDNIVLGGTVIPEPTTVAGGLLGVLGLCWHQRRRLIRSMRLRRA